uniref:Uncharacterized protein n=1 Tax=Moniliophthora roreri TaxID=221103 RepID=A0A0W0FA64_MONRR
MASEMCLRAELAIVKAGCGDRESLTPVWGSDYLQEGFVRSPFDSDSDKENNTSITTVPATFTA